MRDKGLHWRLHRVASELSSSTFLTGGRGSLSYPSPYVDRTAYKLQEGIKLIRERVAGDVRRKLAAVPPGSSSHRISIIEEVAKDWRYESTTSVETALRKTKTTLPSS